MRIKITGRNIELTDGIKDAVEDKLNKLEKYFTPDTDLYHGFIIALSTNISIQYIIFYIFFRIFIFSCNILVKMCIIRWHDQYYTFNKGCNVIMTRHYDIASLIICSAFFASSLVSCGVSFNT